LIINAKSETVFEKKMFQQSIKNKRCIIPATSYFEWQQNNGQKDKIEIFKPQRKFLSLAGIYQTFEDDLGNPIQKFVILTKDPLEAIKNVHDRMPVILDESDERQWLDYTIQDIEKIKSMIYNFNERLDQKISV
jgi:putative SOS response-associated peptidase YedK